MLKVFINPAETLCTLFDGAESGKRVVPITESPYYKAMRSGSPLPILHYHKVGSRRNYTGNMVLLSSVMWTLSMALTIEERGFNPRGYGVWPRLRGRLVVDGQRRVAICAALGLKAIEVENDIQGLYRWWSQAFKVGDGWIDICFPPYDVLLTQDRELCPSVWATIVQELPNLSGKQFLDLGCGPGFYCHRATDAGAVATGIDRDLTIPQHTNANLAQDVVAQAKDTAWVCGYGDRIKYIAADLDQWEPEQEWDVIVALRIHYHLKDPARFLVAASRCAIETLVVQCNPAQPFEAAQIEATQAILSPLWKEVTKAGHLLVCRGKHGN